jgi:hypothetical protein
MRLTIVSVLGQSVQVEDLSRETTTIYELKQKVHELLGSPIPQQILTFHGQELWECNDPNTKGIHTKPFFSIQLHQYYSIILWNGKQYLDAFFTSEEGLHSAIALLCQSKSLVTQYHRYANSRKTFKMHHTLKTYDLQDGDTIYLGYSLNYVPLPERH